MKHMLVFLAGFCVAGIAITNSHAISTGFGLTHQNPAVVDDFIVEIQDTRLQGDREGNTIDQNFQSQDQLSQGSITRHGDELCRIEPLTSGLGETGLVCRNKNASITTICTIDPADQNTSICRDAENVREISRCQVRATTLSSTGPQPIRCHD